MKPPFKIVHKDRSRHHLFASGFYDLERAQTWVDRFNPQMYMDKTLRKEDLLIVPEEE